MTAAGSGHILSVQRISEMLGIEQSKLIELFCVPKNVPIAELDACQVDQALSPVLGILTMAAEMAGDEGRAAIWFKHQPIPGWAGKTAYDLVGEGEAGKVLAYLDAVCTGVYA